MLKNLLRQIAKSQGGFTWLEVLVATVIAGLIGLGAATTIYQVMSVNALSTSHVIACKQVENVSYWLKRDVQMAQNVQPGEGYGFPLNLSWIEWDNTLHQVTYSLQDGDFLRSHRVNGGEPAQNVLAGDIIAGEDMTSCQFNGDGFNFRVTATVNGYRSSTETCIARVIPRPAP